MFIQDITWDRKKGPLPLFPNFSALEVPKGFEIVWSSTRPSLTPHPPYLSYQDFHDHLSRGFVGFHRYLALHFHTGFLKYNHVSIV